MVVNSMSYAKYESYKDSGVDWLGKIPSDWDVEESKWLFSCRKEKANKNDEQLTASQKYGVIPQQVFMDLEERRVTVVYLNPEILKHVEKGDFVISMRSFQGGIEYCDYTGSVSSAYVPLIPNNLIFSPFFKYLFKSSRYIEALQSTSNLVRDGQALRYDNFCMIPLPVVPNETQIKIANFLDQKTAQIDQAIALKQQQIEKLNEYKQIVIQNAVTKGLDPNAPMKNSGVEWIGNIPEHWDVKKLKYLTSKIGSGITPSGGATTYVDKGIPLLRSQNIHFDGLVLDNVANISLNVHKSMKNSQVKQHDVLLNITGGSLGRCCYNSSNDEMNVNQHVCIVRPNNLIKGEFLNGLMSSEVGQKQIWFFQQGGGREGLNFQNLKNFDFPLPSIDEQKEIIAHIESLKQHFKKSVDNYQTQIDRLKEYKNILINQAVTGKIKI